MCFFNAFLTHLRDFFLNRAWSLSSALDAFSCKQSLIFACRQQLIKYRLFTTKTSCFFNLCKVYLHKFVRFISRSRVEPVGGARRLRILRALIAFSCQQQLYGLFCHRRLSAAVLFVWFFNLKISWVFLYTSSLWLYRSVFDDKHRKRRIVRPIIKIEFQDLIFRRIERFKIWQQCVSFLVARVAAVINAHAH